MKKFFVLLFLISVCSFAQYNNIRQTAYELASGDSVITVQPSYLLGSEETAIAIAFDSNWKTGAGNVSIKVYDEVSATYKILKNNDGDAVKFPADTSSVFLITPPDGILLRNFQLIRDSSGTFKNHYGTTTIITIYKIPML